MIGGFGAGSDVTWDLLGSVGYQWNERFAIVAGYRALGVDYDDDGFVYDVIQLRRPCPGRLASAPRPA
jgi:hypothetical protein